MSNEPIIDSMSLEERARLRKQMGDQAIKLAVSSRWLEAANLNREYLRTFGEEADAYNRLGKALSELGEITEARESYSKSLELEPTNTIARRNLDRLAAMKDTAVAAAAPSQLDTRLFVEETGTATVAKLQATDGEVAAVLDAGDLVDLQVQGNAVNVLNTKGDYVGMLEPRIGLRLSRMMTAGNQYSAAVVTTDGDMKVMLRETFKHPSMIDKVSFPQGRSTEIRAYTRKGLLRRDDDEDYGEFGDDEVVEDESDDGWTESDGELDSGTSDIDVEQEDESFD
jgi:tetratricopeptide (TPR) repeat protein